MCKTIDTVLQILITSIICIIVWVVLGFVGFVMDAKRYQHYDCFDREAKSNLCAMILLGGFAFVIVVGLYITDWFNNFMERLIKRLNEK